MAQLVGPGGFLYLSEFHPISAVFGDEDLTIEHDYFQTEPFTYDDPGTYADLEAQTEHNRTEEWEHPVGDVVSAVIDAGLTLELLHEHDYTLFPRWPFLEKDGDSYRMPAGHPRLPLIYSLRAR